jgi:hypothetical protein
VRTGSAALNPELNAQTNLIGVRVPDHPLIRQLVGCCAQPLALTSANRSSEQSPVVIDEFKGLWDELECILDGGTITGTAEQRKGSTVVDLSVAGHYRIIREGVRYASRKKSGDVFRVGIVLDFVRPTTRAPHGAHVRRAKRNRFDRRSRIVIPPPFRYADTLAILLEHNLVELPS